MSDATRSRILEEILSTIEIPDSAYDAAEKRYQDLGSWFGRPESLCAGFDPHISPQGSFRLGTVTRPLNDREAYDLDLTCNLLNGITKQSHTQAQLKALVGADLESYRAARCIEKPLDEKHRCWRLEYADHLNFHMDIVPAIPADIPRRIALQEAMIRAGSAEELAQAVANLAVCITDDRHPFYRITSPEWPVSNPEGFARWFEWCMRKAATFLEKRLLEVRAAKVDDLPTFRWKTPLQSCILILKRHRDIMFVQTPELKPTSIIITSLAGRAYQGEPDIVSAMQRVLSDMGAQVRSRRPRVPNPVDPEEDFTDKWYTPEGFALHLEDNFWRWLEQARADFQTITSLTEVRLLAQQAKQRFGTSLNEDRLREKIGVAAPFVSTLPKSHKIIEPPARPWRR